MDFVIINSMVSCHGDISVSSDSHMNEELAGKIWAFMCIIDKTNPKWYHHFV